MKNTNETKIIGIPGWVIDGKCFGITLSYMRFIARFGTPRIISQEDIYDPPTVDLLMLPGGADISPMTYGEIPSYFTGAPNMALETFDHFLLPYYMDNNTPIFGICRGAQKLWTVLEGSLFQHYPGHTQSAHPTEEAHSLEFTKKFEGFKGMITKVTSRHHQVMTAIDLEKDEILPNDLEIIAYAQDKRHQNYEKVNPEIVEIFHVKNRPIVGVQYHPEDNSTDKFSSMMIRDLLNGELVSKFADKVEEKFEQVGK